MAELDEQTPEARASALGPVAFLRWCWRQLTSMRTALILLLFLAIAAVPGSVVPQDDVDAVAAAQWRRDNPTTAEIYDRLGLFSVYDSVWFSAIYLLLMVSLVGCIIPRTAIYWRAMRARPPKVPSRLTRFAEHREWGTDTETEEILDRAEKALRGYRRDRTETGISAERGYLREAGNLLFHVSLLVVLAGFAAGSMLGFKGGVIVVTGDGFANTATQYDDFSAGAFFDADHLAPFDFTVDDFSVDFVSGGRSAGAARNFAADLTYRREPGAPEQQARLRVNHPLNIDGTDVFLLSHGYAPRITVRNAAGEVASSGPVVFLPENQTFRSLGVVAVPDLAPGKQLGLEGEFYPTYAFTMETGPFSAYPDATNPAISMLVYEGDLGMDDGVPQSVFTLDKDKLDPVRNDEGKPLRLDLAVGKSAQLPDGLGSVTFEGVDRYVKLQVSDNPYQWLALAGVIAALVGLLGSLFIRPRRVWIRVRREGGRTLVEVAGLDRSSGGDLSGEIARVAADLGQDSPEVDSEERPEQEKR